MLAGEKMGEYKRRFIHAVAPLGFPIHTPYADLTDAQKKLLWQGNTSVEGIDGFFRMVEDNLYKIQYRVMLARYRGKTLCPECHGTRLRQDVNNIKINGKTIIQLNQMPVREPS